MTVHPKDGKPFDLKLSHTFNEPQVSQSHSIHLLFNCIANSFQS